MAGDGAAPRGRRCAPCSAPKIGGHPEPIPDLTVSLARLRAIGSSWTGDELSRGAQLLRSSRRTKDALGGTRHGAVVSAVLHPFVQPLVVAQALEDEIERAIDPDGTVRDEASGALRRLRRELRGAQGELVRAARARDGASSSRISAWPTCR